MSRNQHWRSVDTVERDGTMYVLQQRVYNESNHRGQVLEPGMSHRLKELDKVI